MRIILPILAAAGVLAFAGCKQDSSSSESGGAGNLPETNAATPAEMNTNVPAEGMNTNSLPSSMDTNSPANTNSMGGTNGPAQ